jgi:DNA-binding winged helix-turn-helix (wHTH) protein/dienelactone hydrolase
VEQELHSGREGSGPATIVFGPFELDLRAAELRKNGHRIRLQEQPFQILTELLARPGEVVTREELRRKLWPDNIAVEFDHSINAAVKRLRDTLRDSAENPRYIETVARRGYRFIGQIQAPSPPGFLKDSGEAVERIVPSTLQPSRQAPGWLWIPLAAGLALLLAVFALWYRRTAPARWVRNEALPEIQRLVDKGEYARGFPLLYRSQQILPHDARLNKIRREISYLVPIRVTPDGASIYLKPYAQPDAEWLHVGQSPLGNFLLPVGYFRWKVTKPGYETLEVAAGLQGPIEFALHRQGSGPGGMVHVPSGNVEMFGHAPVWLPDFWVDKYEVTNREFQEFVDAGGYRDRRFWREPFLEDGRELSWEEAMQIFRDATGRPGPAGWEVSHYAGGREDFPVTGVSWFEAMAYAAFANKQLPTVYQWQRTASPGIYSDFLLFSNFNGQGPVPAGSMRGLGAFGTYDLAGNAKEWCWNATGSRRYILGGGWNEGRSYYLTPDAVTPFDRSPLNGFRCVRNPAGPPPAALAGPVENNSRDHRREKPVSDSVFRVLQGFYTYDRTALDPVREALDESAPGWRAEKIGLNAAYAHERFAAWLYLPKNSKPPYQTVVYFPAGAAYLMPAIDEAEIHRFDFLMKSGRAVLFPIYHGTYERRTASREPMPGVPVSFPIFLRTYQREPAKPLGPSAERDSIIQQFKDFARALDYLETRKDIALDRLGYFGISGGARLALIFLAQDSRIRAASLAEGGLSSESKPPEIDEINFAPRVRTPVLMLNGRYDFPHPVETDQIPTFRLLGTAEKDKRYVLFDGGHAGPVQQYIRDTLDWFDRYLGPVNGPVDE